MFTLTLDIGGTKALLVSINTLRTLDFTAFHDQAAQHMKRSVEKNYEAEQSPTGTPWRRHSPAYLLWLTRMGSPHPSGILNLSGAMKRSLDTASGPRQGRVFYRSEGYADRLHTLGVTTDVLAAVHTTGDSGRNLPRRPQMGFSSTRGDVAELTAMLGRFVNQVVAHASAVA